jgi:hypothetical protein
MADTGSRGAIIVAIVGAVGLIGGALLTSTSGVIQSLINSRSSADTRQEPKSVEPSQPVVASPEIKNQKPAVPAAVPPALDTAAAQKRAHAIVQQLTSKHWELITHEPGALFHLVLSFNKDFTCDAKASTSHPIPSDASFTCNSYSVADDSMRIYVEESQDGQEWPVEYSLKQQSDAFFQGTEENESKGRQDGESPAIAELRTYR